jgi:DNA topoisomerase-1
MQLGPDDQDGKPKRISIPKGMTPSEVTEEVAIGLLSLPRELGPHPESGEPVEASIGRYGPYVKHQRLFASIPEGEDLLAIELPRALELLKIKEQKRGGTKLGAHPETGDAVTLRDGKYGPYVKHGKTNASLRKDQDPESITLADAVTLLAAKEASKGGGKKRGASGKKSAKKKGGRAKKGAAKAAKKSSKPKKKATKAELAEFLDALDPDVAQVVRRLEGLDGAKPEDLAGIADDLGLSQEEIEARHKRGMFKLRMAYGKARAAQEA